MKILKVFLMILLSAICAKATAQDNIEKRVNDLLSKMTLEEKIGQMNQYTGFWEVTGPAPKGGDAANKYAQLKAGQIGSMLNVIGVIDIRAVQKIAVEQTRLGIPLIIGYDVIHGFKTLSPIPLAEAASFDLEAIKKSASFAAKEAAAAGINWTFAPMMDISRDARWGRVMEGAGEDAYYGALVAAARVQGFQGNFSESNVAACAKHYAGYGFAEGGRDYNTVDVSIQRLYNDILPPFAAAAKAGALTFMNSFNTLNGVPATASTLLQRDILKGKWNFNGFVVSDWGSVREIMNHGYAANEAQAGIMAITAGSDMDMEGGIYVTQLAQLVRDGVVKESLIDDAVRRILRVKFQLGLFDNPYKYLDENREKMVTGSKEMHDVVLEMAKKSIVLLQNNNNILPLKKSGVKIALIGELAGDKNSPLGSWRGAAPDNSAVSVLEGMQKYTGNTLTYAKGTNVFNGRQGFAREVNITPDDRSGFAQAVEAARKADVVVMVLGEYAFMTGEGRSRTSLDLPGNQQELLKEVLAVNKNVVLVLNNGRPLALEWEAANVPAIVEAWHLGTEAGNAVAQVLYGDYNPSGKLPMSFPHNIGQVPMFYNMLSTGRGVKTDVFWSHYTDAPNTALFPFGHGLSYTTFEYKNLKLNKTNYAKGDPIKVTVDITNTGSRDGKEVAQLYLHDIAASIAQPMKKLRGFQMVELRKGETKTVEFTLTDAELGFFNNDGQYLVESGDFTVFVGGSSTATLKADFKIAE